MHNESNGQGCPLNETNEIVLEKRLAMQNDFIFGAYYHS